VRNVDDPPVIIGPPSLEAEPGVTHTFDVVAFDGDNEVIRYRLSDAPVGMSIGPMNGTIQWLPRARGTHGVTVIAEDGNSSVSLRLLISVPNRPPRVSSTPPPRATTGTAYVYLLTAEDPNLDALTYSILEAPRGVRLRPDTGRISWTPGSPGEQRISVEVWDGEESTVHTFTVLVAQGAWEPDDMLVAGSILLTIIVVLLFIAARTELGKFAMTLLLLPLYSRLHRSELLDNEIRGMIRGCIYTDPGIHYNEILRRLKITTGTAAYHLATLRREGLVKSRNDGRLKRFYPAEMSHIETMVRLTKTDKMILETVKANEGISQGNIAISLGMPYPTVNRHVKGLVKTGMLRLDRHGMTIRCFTNNEGAHGVAGD